ncbi:hypothetical protein BDN70DRAFT_248061 [Pholiota conissans]|uniref:Uncharacterized protein n=1 Tax=Pholiota conissans TaxID=109636 RepID=A0A9P5YTX4_9AGAR|nr:hypothetical protein BDN70DRAFT_248061 [Pholiota conissans]
MPRSLTSTPTVSLAQRHPLRLALAGFLKASFSRCIRVAVWRCGKSTRGVIGNGQRKERLFQSYRMCQRPSALKLMTLPRSLSLINLPTFLAIWAFRKNLKWRTM